MGVCPWSPTSPPSRTPLQYPGVYEEVRGEVGIVVDGHPSSRGVVGSPGGVRARRDAESLVGWTTHTTIVGGKKGGHGCGWVRVRGRGGSRGMVVDLGRSRLFRGGLVHQSGPVSFPDPRPQPVSTGIWGRGGKTLPTGSFQVRT